MQADKVEAAGEHMRNAVELRSEDEWIYIEIGRYLVDTGRPELAAETYIVGLEVLPESEPLHIALVQLYFQESFLERNPAQAEAFASQLVESFPDDPLFQTLMAHAMIRNGKMDEARRELDAVLSNHPDMAEAHLINGTWFRKNRQFIQARREYRFALELAGDREWLRRTIEREMEGISGE